MNEFFSGQRREPRFYPYFSSVLTFSAALFFFNYCERHGACPDGYRDVKTKERTTYFLRRSRNAIVSYSEFPTAGSLIMYHASRDSILRRRLGMTYSIIRHIEKLRNQRIGQRFCYNHETYGKL
ncbi:MAG: hypothetical protein ABSA44_08850 [Bacteroidota bacterium]